MVHEIWMLFISPANPDFSGQTPSTGKHYRWKKNYRNKLGSLSCRTHKHTSHWHGRKHKKVHSFLSQASQQTHYYHTQTKIHTHTHTHTHTLRWGKTMHTLASQCLPEDQRELWKLTSRATLHVHGSPQNTSHCCPSFWLPSTTPPPQTSQHPHLTTLHHPPWPDGFFFNCLWALAPLLYHTKSLRWLGGVEGLGALRGQMVRR